MTTAITGGTLVDGAGNPPVANGLVLIEKDRIAYAGPANGARIPDGVTVVDAKGCTVLPGLMDVHVHISMSSPTDWRLDHYRRSPGRIPARFPPQKLPCPVR